VKKYLDRSTFAEVIVKHPMLDLLHNDTLTISACLVPLGLIYLYVRYA